MLTLSATCLAIANAMKSKTLDIVEHMGREIRSCDGQVLIPAGPYWVIADQHGTIETHLSLEALNNRISEIEGTIA